MELIQYHSTNYMLGVWKKSYLLINMLDKIIYLDMYLNTYCQATSHQLLHDAALQTKQLTYSPWK